MTKRKPLSITACWWLILSALAAFWGVVIALAGGGL